MTVAGFAFGRTLVIANPTSASGRGAAGAQALEDLLISGAYNVGGIDMRLTTQPGDATRIAAGSGDADTLVVLSGDGVIHEAVNGLMQVEPDRRPCLAVVALGSGNDFARTIGMPRNRVKSALRCIDQGTRRRLDLGRVNGTYFMQTLSFGLDAAIALGSMDRRVKNRSRGTRLFGAVGLDVFGHPFDPYAYHAALYGIDGADGAAETRELLGDEIIFAVQVGPTYGGGFRICPSASPTDGLLDLCYSATVPSRPHALALFARARFGLHASSKVVQFAQFKRAVVDFEREPPAQVDGERLTGTHFEIETVPAALEVVVAR